MSVTLLAKCLDNGHIAEFDLLLCVLRKLRKPSSDFLFFVDIGRRKRIFTSKNQINLSAKLLCSFASLSSIPVPGNMISSFVDRRERQK